jgi:hypothetical protein
VQSSQVEEGQRCSFSCINNIAPNKRAVMTSQSPTIYLYKITFEEVPYYYYGVKKEKYFNEEYWGSPYTNKWCWELYTPKKQILQLFDFTDEGWIEAQEVETRLIRTFYNTDKWCLNESCGGKISLEVLRESGNKNYKEKKGIHSFTFEERSVISKKNYENKKGIHGLTFEERSEHSKKIGQKLYSEKKGIFSLTTERRVEIGRKNSSQKWMCTETDYISNPCGLSHYQKARGIDTSKRVRIS